MVLKPPRAERLAIEGPAGALQALLETPVTERGEALTVPAFAVVCHPHPLFGGTMDNKVVYTVARAFEQLGAPAIRFNFRGVAASAGTYDEGRGEGDDALAVIAWGRQRFPDTPLWLAGFSFGGAVALRIAELAQPERLVLVAPGITRLQGADLAAPRAPQAHLPLARRAGRSGRRRARPGGALLGGRAGACAGRTASRGEPARGRRPLLP